MNTEMVVDELAENTYASLMVGHAVIRDRKKFTPQLFENVRRFVYTESQLARRPVVEPGTVGVQKYGVQMVCPKVIWIYRLDNKF